MPKLQVFPVAILGGIQDSKPIPQVGDMQQLQNFALFRGRFGLRAPVIATARMLSDAAHETPAPVDHVLGTRIHKGKMYVMAWRGGAVNRTYLYRLEVTGIPEGGVLGGDASPVATVWTGATVPRVSMASFDGGSATAPVSRLYLADYTETFDTRFWNSDVSTINDLEEDLNDDGTKEDLRFHLVWVYQFHVWGAGFFQASASRRPEIARFSQPGAIPADEPNVTNNISREWWSVDFRPIGRRGDRITAVAFAGGASILFKRRETFALFGYDAESWAVRTVSDRVGCAGPWAAAATEDGLCFFWSDRGPQVTDGQSVKDLSIDIKKVVNELGVNEEISVEYSQDDGIVYFYHPNQNIALAYDKVHERWMKEEWLKSGGGVLEVNSLSATADDALPGPAAAPTSLVATSVSDSQINLTWTNGDTAGNTKTRVHRSTTASFTPDSGNQIAELDAGVASYQNTTGLASITTYFYKVRHIRNGIFSTNSNEASAKTWLKEPTSLSTSALVNGIRVTLTNNEAGADIQIERKLVGGSFSLLTTLLAQSTGVKTHNDTSTTCGLSYTYRARVTKTGETTSEYSSESTSQACQTPDITSVNASANGGNICGPPEGFWIITVSWQTDFPNDTDYRIDIERATNFSGDNFATWLTDKTTNDSFEADDTGLQGNTGGSSSPSTFYRKYRIKLIRRSDLAIVESMDTLQVQITFFTDLCA